MKPTTENTMSREPDASLPAESAATLELARRWIELLNRRDVAGLNEILSADHLYSAMWRNPPEYALRYTKERFFKEIVDWQQHMKSPVTMTIVSEFAHGSRAVLETESHGVADDGYVYANSYCFLYWVENGKITAIHDYCCTNTARLYEDHLRSTLPGKNFFDELAHS
jgi:ketosteroid isomerase-like protein